MDAQTTQVLLEQLRDVHLPDAVSWWPPAPGWWVLALAALGAMVWLIKWFISRRQRNAYRRTAIDALNRSERAWQKEKNTSAYLKNASQILRRVAMHLNGREAVASLTQDAWIALIGSMTRESISQTLRDSMTIDVYHPDPQVDVPALHSELVSWLRNHRKPDAGKVS